jgi:hypothetical protein
MELDGRRLQLAMSREIKISDGDEVVVTGELAMSWSASHTATSPVPFWGGHGVAPAAFLRRCTSS